MHFTGIHQWLQAAVTVYCLPRFSAIKQSMGDLHAYELGSSLIVQFAEDVDLLAQAANSFDNSVTTVCQADEDFGLRIKMDKSKVMSMGKNNAVCIGL
jgi:hypothetical protein